MKKHLEYFLNIKLDLEIASVQIKVKLYKTNLCVYLIVILREDKKNV